MRYRSFRDPAYARARRLQAETGLIDLHVDPLLQRRLFGYELRRRHRAGIPGQPLFGHADIPRMREAGYGGAVMGVHYWPWESERGWREARRQIGILDRVAGSDPRCLRVRRPEDWDRARDEGLLALAPCVEGAHMLGGKLSRVAGLARRDVACLTLVHLSRNSAATPSMGRGANETDGLTDFGRALVTELNRGGIAIDVAHANSPGALEACRASRAPVLCSHTGARAVNDHPRCVTDEVLRAVAETDGAVGVIFGARYLAGRFRITTEAILDHVDHIVRRVGHRHVSVGSDYDGWLSAYPVDHRDCRDTVKLTDGLIRRGYGEEKIRGLLRDNALRVLHAVREAADRD